MSKLQGIIRGVSLVGGGKPLPSWSSLDGIPRIGGLCIEYGSLLATSNREVNEKITIDYEIMTSPLHSPVERVPSPSDHADTVEMAENEHLDDHSENHVENEDNNQQDEGVFGFENNFQYLAPGICDTEPRNPSQVSGSSTDSGYHGNNHSRQRKTGLWTITNCECMSAWSDLGKGDFFHSHMLILSSKF